MKSQADINGIKAFVMDVDGVLTDGRIGYGTGSDDEIKFFDVKDGLGIQLLKRAGILVIILSGRMSKANNRRASELGINKVIEGCKSKASGMEKLCSHYGISPEECLYIGDDLIDIPAMRMAGVAVAVADASEHAKKAAHWVMEHKGGRGAVREAAERLLAEQGKLDNLLADYIGRG